MTSLTKVLAHKYRTISTPSRSAFAPPRWAVIELGHAFSCGQSLAPVSARSSGTSDHQLGVGSIGTLVAHHLRLSNPHSPISLIAKKARHVPSTRVHPYGLAGAAPVTLRVERDRQLSTSTNYEIEVWHDGTAEQRLLASEHGLPVRPGHDRPEPHPPNCDIQSLVVCLKTTSTVEALALLRPRLSPSSVITLIQNGMGIYDELCASLWPDPSTRPYFILGTTTHGSRKKEADWSITHNTRPGAGDIRFGIVPDPRAEINFEKWIWGGIVSSNPILAPPASPPIPLPPAPKASNDLQPMKQTIEALLSMSDLSPTLLPMPHLHHQLLLKLAINSVINPLTAILGSGSLPNGALFGSPPAHILIRQLAKETSHVIQVYLGSLSEPHAPPPDVLRLFSADSIERRVLEVVRSTSDNVSSMAGDVSRGRLTEIDHINGYIRALAKRLKVATPHHDMVIAMVRYTAEINGLAPWASERVSRGIEGKKSWLAKQWKRAPRTPGQIEQAEKHLEMEERRVLLAEKELELAERQMQQELRASRVQREGEKKVQLHVNVIRNVRQAKAEGREGAEDLEVPKLRRDKRKLLRSLGWDGSAEPRNQALSAARRKQKEEKSLREGNERSQVLPRSAESLSTSSPASAPAQAVARPEADSPKVGSAAWMDQMISSAPRQERTWDVPAKPPTARGPVPKKRSDSATDPKTPPVAGSTGRAPSTQPTPASTPTSSSSGAAKPLSMQEMMSSMIASAPRHDSSGPTVPPPASASDLSSDPTTPPEHPSIPTQSSGGSPLGSSIDSLISSAPRATRSWESRGGTITGYTSPAPSLAATVGMARVQGVDLARGGIGGALDHLISASPRQERTWDVEARGAGAKDLGKYSTSRTSGS